VITDNDWLYTEPSTRVEFVNDGTVHFIESDGTEKIVPWETSEED
jgi:hypothetical protein